SIFSEYLTNAYAQLITRTTSRIVKMVCSITFYRSKNTKFLLKSFVIDRTDIRRIVTVFFQIYDMCCITIFAEVALHKFNLQDPLMGTNTRLQYSHILFSTYSFAFLIAMRLVLLCISLNFGEGRILVFVNTLRLLRTLEYFISLLFLHQIYMYICISWNPWGIKLTDVIFLRIISSIQNVVNPLLVVYRFVNITCLSPSNHAE
ncbi:hypothetical protein L9F63_024364, partial [Diploptera punctata]